MLKIIAALRFQIPQINKKLLEMGKVVGPEHSQREVLEIWNKIFKKLSLILL